jgi:hypothetical protein
MAYGCLGIRLTLVMCLMLDIKLTLYQNFIYMVSYDRENNFQSYIIHQYGHLPFDPCWVQKSTNSVEVYSPPLSDRKTLIFFPVWFSRRALTLGTS